MTLFFVVPADDAAAQSETPTGPATQVWANLTGGKTLGERWYLQLDVEPRVQVTSGEQWRSFDLTPLAERSPLSWLDLESEVGIGRTHQRDGLDTVELTPRVGVRLHLFAEFADVVTAHERRLPLKRFGLSTLARLEWRNLYYSDSTPDSHEWRLRLRVEGKLALNRSRLADDGAVYAMADAEYYEPLGEDVTERYVNKARVRIGAGYRISRLSRIELLYVRDWNRKAPGAAVAEDSQAIDLRVKRLF